MGLLNIIKDKHYKIVRKCLVRHAENYIDLESDEAKRKEDKAVYKFLHVVDGEKKRALIRKHYKFYNRLKQRFIREYNK